MSTPTVFAIDFGTSNSLLAAASRDQLFPPIPLDLQASDPTVLRSAFYFTRMNEPAFFGTGAIREFVANGFRGRLIRSIKRHLPSKAFTKTRIGDQLVTLEDLVGAFLKSIRETGCKHFGTDVRRVVLGRPARFSNEPDEDQLAQDRLDRAARRAGFEEVTFCPEPIAAAYDFADDLEEPKTVLIADLGGGTSDYTIVKMTSNGFAPEDVRGIGGISVAGDAIDGALVRSEVAPEFGSRAHYMAPFGANVLDMPKLLIELLASPADLTLGDRTKTLKMLGDIRAGLVDPSDRVKIDRFVTVVEDGVGFSLYEAVEGAKRALSDLPRTHIALDYPGAEFDIETTRPELDRVASVPIERMIKSLDEVFERSGVDPDAIDIACLTGGTSRMPAVEAAFRARLPRSNFRRLSSFHSVVQGLSRRAQELAV